MEGSPIDWLISRSGVVTLTGPWSFLSPSDNLRQIADESDVLTSLQESSTAQELQAARIIANDATGQPALSPVLKRQFLVVRTEKGGAPVDIVSMGGSLTGIDPPALHCGDDSVTSTRAAKYGFVLATFSTADLAALGMLGLPVTPAVGLSTLTANQARRLLTAPQQPPVAAPQTDGAKMSPAKRPKLILVGLDVCGLRNQMPVGVLNAVKQFQRAERALKLDTAPHVALWLPSAADFRDVGDAVRLADSTLVRKAITASVKSSSLSISDYLKSTSGRPANDLNWAQKKLVDAISALPKSMFGTRDVTARLDELKRAFDIAFIERIQRDAMSAADPLGGVLLTIAGELMRMQFEQSELGLQAKAIIESGSASIVDVSFDDRLSAQCEIAEKLIRIKKTLEK